MKNIIMALGVAAAFAGCSGNENKWDAPRKELAAWKDKACACKDKACADKLKSEIDAWDDKMEKRFGSEKPPEKEMEAMMKEMTALQTCIEKFEQ